jgi:hypothetical protein
LLTLTAPLGVGLFLIGSPSCASDLNATTEGKLPSRLGISIPPSPFGGRLAFPFLECTEE